MRDAEHQHAEPGSDAAHAADLDLKLAADRGEREPLEAIRDDQRGEVPLVDSPVSSPYRALMVTFDGAFGLAAVPRAQVALLSALVSSLAQGLGAPASCWRYGSSGGPRAP